MHVEMNRRPGAFRSRRLRLSAAAASASLVVLMGVASPAAAADQITLSVTVMVDSGEESCGSATEIQVDEGTVVRWCYSLTNTGDSTLTHHDLQSTVFGPILTGQVLTLVPDASTSVTVVQEITADTVDQATWTASNPQGGVTVSDSASATVTRHVVNQPPVAGTAQYTTTEGQPVDAAAPALLDLASDPDGDPLTVAPGATGPANGSVEIRADGSFTYRPAPGFVGTDGFTFVVFDGIDSATGSVSILVNAGPPTTNPPPSVNPPSAQPGPGPGPRPGGPGRPNATNPSGPTTPTPRLPASGADPFPLALVGLGLVGAGGLALSSARRVRPAAVRSRFGSRL